jgi:hypothetical protein
MRGLLLLVQHAACTTPNAEVAPDTPGASPADLRVTLLPHDHDAKVGVALLDPAHALPDGACFLESPPESDTFVADVPPPPWSACAHPSVFALTQQKPATLQIDLAWHDGDWAKAIEGPQGGSHLWAGFRVVLPGRTTPDAKLLASGEAFVDCLPTGDGADVATVGVLAGVTGTYGTEAKKNQGVFVHLADDGPSVMVFCDRWVELRLTVVDPLTQQWGEARVRIRLYLDAIAD